jgi:hypothetical protein
MASLFAPGGGPHDQPQIGVESTLGLLDRRRLLQEVFPLLLLLFPGEVLAALVRDIAQLVKQAALVEHAGAIDQGQGSA